MDMEKDEDEAIHIPIDGVLDLHLFAPKETASVVEEYLRACLEKGIHEVRIIHGKGKGILRRQVHALLKRNPLVRDFSLDPGPSGWGVSIARLKQDSRPLNGSD
ncbi:Smr/MutS family protein [Thermodesulfobacteriota bacterium]